MVKSLSTSSTSGRVVEPLSVFVTETGELPCGLLKS